MITDQVSGESYYNDSEPLLLYWQKKIFTWLFFLLVAGLLPFLLSCRSALENGQGIRIFFYSSLYIWVLGVLFLKKIPFEKRAGKA